jgi:hypothetical protein
MISSAKLSAASILASLVLCGCGGGNDTAPSAAVGSSVAASTLAGPSNQDAVSDTKCVDTANIARVTSPFNVTSSSIKTGSATLNFDISNSATAPLIRICLGPAANPILTADTVNLTETYEVRTTALDARNSGLNDLSNVSLSISYNTLKVPAGTDSSNLDTRVFSFTDADGTLRRAAQVGFEYVNANFMNPSTATGLVLIDPVKNGRYVVAFK